MNALKTVLVDLKQDEEGAAFLEYTVLLAIILAVTIGTIIAVGNWASGQWTTLLNQLPGANSAP